LVLGWFRGGCSLQQPGPCKETCAKEENIIRERKKREASGLRDGEGVRAESFGFSRILPKKAPSQKGALSCSKNQNTRGEGTYRMVSFLRLAIVAGMVPVSLLLSSSLPFGGKRKKKHRLNKHRQPITTRDA